MSSAADEALERSTLANQAYERVRARILDGRLPPGSRVVVRPLCTELGLSPTPIRAALSALEQEGLLIATAHRGYSVTTVTGDEMRDIYELREALDGVAAGRVATKGPAAAQLVPLLEWLLEEQRRCVSDGSLSRYSDLDLAFHREIWKASGNARLLETVEGLSGLVRLGSGTSSQVPGRLPAALAEHRAIVQAIVDGDAEGAAAAARAHVRNADIALQHHLATADAADRHG